MARMERVMIEVDVNDSGKVHSFRIDGGEMVKLKNTPEGKLLGEILTRTLPAAATHYRQSQCKQAILAVESFVLLAGNDNHVLSATRMFIDAAPDVVIRIDDRVCPF